MFNQKFAFLVSIFSKFYENLFTISPRGYIRYIRNTLSNESDCFHYHIHKNMVLPGNIDVIIIPKDTPQCSELHHLK